MRIGTNIAALQATRVLEKTTRALSRALERLASGKRINSAGDDAAGLAISTGLESQVRATTQVAKNLNDAQAILSTADGAIAQQSEIVQRMQELALQAANGTISAQDRSYLNREFQQLLDEFQRITTQTDFNQTKLLDGSFQTTSVQVGGQANENISFSLGSMQSSQVFAKSVTNVSYAVSGDHNELNVPDHWSAAIGGYQLEDVDGDGHLDFLARLANGDISVNRGDGKGNFTTLQTISGSTGRYLYLKDINGDGKLDIVDTTSTQIKVRMNNGDGTFGNATVTALNSTGDFAFGDVNHDGKEDLLSDYGYVLLGNGDGTFRQLSTTFANDYRGIGVADLNNDGNLDVFDTEWIDERSISVSLGNGDGTFRYVATYAVNTSADFAYTTYSSADLDGDGNMDLIIPEGYNPGFNVLLGNGDGTFKPNVFYNNPGNDGEFVKVADMNNDSIPDVVVSGAFGQKIGVFLGNGDGSLYLSQSVQIGGGDPAIGDINEDGVQDIIGASADATNTFQVVLGSGQVQSVSALSQMKISTQSAAQNVLGILKTALNYISTVRSNIGASQSRLSSAANVSEITAENLSQAKSQIMDADVAAETAELTRTQVLQQAGAAVLSQANLQSQTALKLLQQL